MCIIATSIIILGFAAVMGQMSASHAALANAYISYENSGLVQSFALMSRYALSRSSNPGTAYAMLVNASSIDGVNLTYAGGYLVVRSISRPYRYAVLRISMGKDSG